MSNHILSPTVDVPAALIDMANRMDAHELERIFVLSREADLTYTNYAVMPLPAVVDHSAYISYVRHQGAYGCAMNALAACFDVFFAKDHWPNFHPNISVNRMLWAWSWTLRCYPENRPCDQRHKENIPGLWGLSYKSLNDYLYHFGCPTEGTEFSDSDGIKWPTNEGNYECSNFRLGKCLSSVIPEDVLFILVKDYELPLKVNLNELKFWLQRGPVRAGIWDNQHSVALVGYDDNTARIKFINSWGDRYGENGFGYIAYNNLDKEVDSAEVFWLKAPRPVPCARIRFKSQHRQDVHLWLGVEGRTHSKCIWPTGQRQDNSWNLSLTVTLPRGFSWPPSEQNHVFLDVYDLGAHSNAGGSIEEFTVGFCGQYHYCPQIVHGVANNIGAPAGNPPHGGGQWITPKSFKPHEMMRLTVP